MTKALEHISSAMTKELCMHFVQVSKVMTLEALVADFDTLCSNVMSHRRGLVSEPIVQAPVGKMACKHTYAYLQSMPVPTEPFVNPSAAELCGTFQEMVNGAVAHLAQEDEVAETMERIAAVRQRKAAEALQQGRDDQRRTKKWRDRDEEF